MKRATPHIFQGYGLELEYMIADRDSLDLMPVTDRVLARVAGAAVDDVERGLYGWSNELVLHVIEIKNSGPVADIAGLAASFQREVEAINSVLAGMNARLLPGAMHPWMDPAAETRLWPHGCKKIYNTYDRIFGCRGHGWSNLQSTHLNLAFRGDEEFGRLHAAIRLLLPILPAAAASSPFAGGKPSGLLDTRLHYYRRNQQLVPAIAGMIIPERVFSRRQYSDRIFRKIYREIGPHDPEGVLRHEWLNSRGAIARFERSSIEIRLLDIQECPAADLAIASAIISALKMLVREEWADFARQRESDEQRLLPILLRCIESGEKAVIDDPDFLALFAFPGRTAAAGELWWHIIEATAVGIGEIPYRPVFEEILSHGTLAGRLLGAAGPDPGRGRLREIYRELAGCLADGRLFLP